MHISKKVVLIALLVLLSAAEPTAGAKPAATEPTASESAADKPTAVGTVGACAATAENSSVNSSVSSSLNSSLNSSQKPATQLKKRGARVKVLLEPPGFEAPVVGVITLDGARSVCPNQAMHAHPHTRPHHRHTPPPCPSHVISRTISSPSLSAQQPEVPHARRYCNDDSITVAPKKWSDTDETDKDGPKIWNPGDPLNKESYWSAGYRCTYHLYCRTPPPRPHLL